MSFAIIPNSNSGSGGKSMEITTTSPSNPNQISESKTTQRRTDSKLNGLTMFKWNPSAQNPSKLEVISKKSDEADIEHAEKIKKVQEIVARLKPVLEKWEIDKSSVLDALVKSTEEESHDIIHYIYRKTTEPTLKNVLIELIKKLISETNEPITLFRTSTDFTTNCLKKYINKYGANFIKNIVEAMQKTLPSQAPSNNNEFIKIIIEILNKVNILTKDSNGNETKEIFQLISMNLSEKGKNIAVSTFFLLFICPKLIKLDNPEQRKFVKAIQLYCNSLMEDIPSFKSLLGDKHADLLFLAEEKNVSAINEILKEIGGHLTNKDLLNLQKTEV
jgi:hypothetical protein